MPKNKQNDSSSRGGDAVGAVVSARIENKGPGHIIQEDPASRRKKGKSKGKNNVSKRGLLINGIIVVAVGAMIGAAVFLVFSGYLEHPGAKKAVAGAPTQFIELPEFITTLDAGDDDHTYARMDVELEVADAVSAAAVNSLMPAIMDVFQTYLHSMTADDLHSPGGLYRLRKAVLSRVNVIVAPAVVQNVLLIQTNIQ